MSHGTDGNGEAAESFRRLHSLALLQGVATTLCHTLQRTATHCNTMQHTATHRNTPQHTASVRGLRSLVSRQGVAATHCNTLQHVATTSTTLQHARPIHSMALAHFTSRCVCARVCAYVGLGVGVDVGTDACVRVYAHVSVRVREECSKTVRVGEMHHCMIARVLHHTATHCNAVQHTATHTATHAATHIATHFNTLQHTLQHTLQRTATR